MSTPRPRSQLADGPRPWFGRAQAVPYQLPPTAYQALLWLTTDLHSSKTGPHPSVQPTLLELQTWMGKPSTGTVLSAVRKCESAGAVSIRPGRNGSRNTYRFESFGDPLATGPVPCIGPAPLVPRVAALPSILTPSTGLRTLLLVCAVAQGTDDSFAVSRADLFTAARLGHSQGTELVKALKAPRQLPLLGEVPPLLELVRSGAGPRPSEHRLVLPHFELPDRDPEVSPDD